ncbi:hypothetical protein GF356_13295 [candidate division GN15 bacterium]|nr:hypothetical protein [candidate division GN15 bacterium]
MSLTSPKDETTVWRAAFQALRRPEVYVIFVLAFVLRGALAAMGIDQQGLESMLTAAPDANNYLNIARANLNDITYLHRLILPKEHGWCLHWETEIHKAELQYLPASLVLLGLAMLLVLGRFRALVILGSFFGYFLMLIGTAFFQGSRLIYPAYFSGDVLISVALAGPVLLIREFGLWSYSSRRGSDQDSS